MKNNGLDHTISLRIPAGAAEVEALLAVPNNARGLVIFVHGSGSGRLSPRNQFVAGELQQAGFATLLADLLTEAEDQNYQNRFNINLLAARVADMTRWALRQPQLAKLPIGYFGASTGAAAAFEAAAELKGAIKTIISRGGRPDLSKQLSKISAPSLFIVGELDREVLKLHKQAFTQLNCQYQLLLVPQATHLFEEPGALEQMSALAVDWVKHHLAG